ncbi:response regulator [Thiocystis violacea]|uniref:response regulator n=1 Tax=Thiocystis violacea TaxID=13725 RepID=UPI00190881DC|nr:response regulator [Thiocystis violacea]MBK1719523.1 response regulator [Thiocystis violacea]
MKILLVDDSKSARYALRLQLQRYGVEVDTADCAESAFTKLKTSLPDAILMDHMMPGLNGFEALEVIREDPRTAAIPVIMCTSHEEPEFVATAKKKGVFGILPKSAAPELLPEMMERLQDKLKAGTGRAPAVEPSSATSAPADRGPSNEAITKLVDNRLEQRLSKLLPPLVEELRRDLTESILNESHRMMEQRLSSEQTAKRSAAPQPTMADLQAISTRLATETLPDLIKRAILAERGVIMESLEKYLRDVQPRAGASGSGTQEDSQDIALKAVSMARRESQETLKTALGASQQSIQALEQGLQKAMGKVYGLVALAAVLGMGAAGLVYYLLKLA